MYSNYNANFLNELPSTTVLIQYGTLPSLDICLDNIAKMLERANEIVMVNPSTYAALDIDLTKAYLETKSILSKLEYIKSVYLRELDKLKLQVLFEDYANFIADKDKKQDTVMVKEMYLNTHPKIVELKEQIDKISFVEGYVEGALKSFDNLSKIAKKQIDIVLHSTAPTFAFNMGET